jgi:hypothetical protein
MATVTLGGNPISTLPIFRRGNQGAGFHPHRGRSGRRFSFRSTRGESHLNVFPSIDTAVCATSVEIQRGVPASLSNAVVLAISGFLPRRSDSAAPRHRERGHPSRTPKDSDFGKAYRRPHHQRSARQALRAVGRRRDEKEKGDLSGSSRDQGRAEIRRGARREYANAEFPSAVRAGRAPAAPR